MRAIWTITALITALALAGCSDSAKDTKDTKGEKGDIGEKGEAGPPGPPRAKGRSGARRYRLQGGGAAIVDRVVRRRRADDQRLLHWHLHHLSAGSPRQRRPLRQQSQFNDVARDHRLRQAVV